MLDQAILVITGGTGSFGNAVLRRSLATAVREIRIFSRDEKKQDDMRRAYSDTRLKYYLGDVRDPSTLRPVLNGADVVFHAAALKQVPSCEFYPLEAIRTNTLGTDNVLQGAADAGVKRVVVLSTDKAAYPINAMGMSKALAERIAVARSRAANFRGTIFCITRYGNVLASRGSVIPHFLNQAKAGVPLTITDPAMTRFMMSLDEAVDLVQYAFEHAEPGDLFVRNSPAATLEVLVQALELLCGRELPRRIIGTRHGEKLFETLLTREEMARAKPLGDYLRVPADTRDLNYSMYDNLGEASLSAEADLTSHNSPRLGVAELADRLRSVPEVRSLLAEAL